LSAFGFGGPGKADALVERGYVLLGQDGAETAPARSGTPAPLPCRDCLLWHRIELAQEWQHFVRKQHNVRDGVFMVEETALPEHRQIAKAADLSLSALI
jgi:hypothetical protein